MGLLIIELPAAAEAAPAPGEASCAKVGTRKPAAKAMAPTDAAVLPPERILQYP